MTSQAFVSPLAVSQQSELITRDFGPVELLPDVRRLAHALEAAVRKPIDRLPLSMRAEAKLLLDAYPGPEKKFIDLFYVPIWSFLSHVPRQSGLRLSPRATSAVRSAHALSLFLHLWDDHLTDNQLGIDVLRLQWRTLAWMQFSDAARQLSRSVPQGSAAVDRLITSYLQAVHRPERASDFDAYCNRFHDQIGIWRVTPVVIGWLAGGERAATALDSAICSFATAWRVMDDLQDLEDDLRSGQESAVFHLLEPAEKRVWTDLRSAQGTADELPSWSRFWDMLERGRIVERVLDRITVLLERAARTALSEGWDGWAADISASGNFADTL